MWHWAVAFYSLRKDSRSHCTHTHLCWECPGYSLWHSCCLSPRCSMAKTILLGSMHGTERDSAQHGVSTYDADRNGCCGCWRMHNSVGQQQWPPQVHSMSWADFCRARLAPTWLQKEFPTRQDSQHICSHQTSKKCQRSQGNETHTEPAKWANKHRQKKARASDQMNSDQNSGFKMGIKRVLKSWAASQNIQRAADQQFQEGQTGTELCPWHGHDLGLSPWTH